jgi:hypothetical protein
VLALGEASAWVQGYIHARCSCSSCYAVTEQSACYVEAPNFAGMDSCCMAKSYLI